MANLKLKDGIGQEQNYEDIKEVAIPKADGSGYEFYMERPTIYYTLLDPPTYDLSAEDTSFIALNDGEGAILGKAYDKGNFYAGISAAVSGKTTKSIVVVDGTDVTGIGEGEKKILYLYESVSGAILKEIVGFEGATDFVAQPGWGYFLGDNSGVTGYAQIADPSTVSIGCLQPNRIYSEKNFYALFSETSQETKTVSVTENGSQKIVPSEGKSGIREMLLNVNVQGGAAALQEKTVEITQNGTTEVTPDTGYDGLSKATVNVNVAGGGSGVQANWAQNDNTAADYVKNRPGGFYIPGMSAQTVTFDGVETGRETIDLSALGLAGFKFVKVSDLMLYPINFDGCTIKGMYGGTETQASSFTVDYRTDYGVATVITDANHMPIILSVVSDYTLMGIIFGAGTWFISSIASGIYISSLALPDTSGQMLNVNIPARLLDIVVPMAGEDRLGVVKANSAKPVPNIGDRVVIDPEGFLRYQYKAVTVNNDLTDEQKIAARKSINLYENAAFYGNFLINRDEGHSTLGNVNSASGFLNFLFGMGNIVSSANFAPYCNAVFGEGNQVSGIYHFVFGSHLVSADNFGLAIGKYNDLVNSYNKAFVIGGGDAEASRKNVFSVDWNGNIEAGKSIILESSTAGSTKKFKITVDDAGTLTATEAPVT